MKASQINHKIAPAAHCTKADRRSLNQQYRGGGPAHLAAGDTGSVSESFNEWEKECPRHNKSLSSLWLFNQAAQR